MGGREGEGGEWWTGKSGTAQHKSQHTKPYTNTRAEFLCSDVQLLYPGILHFPNIHQHSISVYFYHISDCQIGCSDPFNPRLCYSNFN